MEGRGGDAADEIGLLDDLCTALPPGRSCGSMPTGLDRRRAEQWLKHCAERPVEFVEQPCLAEAAQGESGRRKVEDILLAWPPTTRLPSPWTNRSSAMRHRPLAGGRLAWHLCGEPALLGDVPGAIARLAKARADVVFSSAFETALGTQAALWTAFGWASSTGSAVAMQVDRGGPRPPGAARPASDAIRRPEVGGHLSVQEFHSEIGLHGYGSGQLRRQDWDRSARWLRRMAAVRRRAFRRAIRGPVCAVGGREADQPEAIWTALS